MKTLAPLLSILLIAPATGASDWYVDAAAAGPGSGTINDPYLEIQDAIEAGTTLDGDTVIVFPGTYEPIDLLAKTLVVRSTAGAASTTIDGGFAAPTVRITGGSALGTRIEGFLLRNGVGPNVGMGQGGGGVVVVTSSVEIAACIIEDCTAGTGAINQGGGVAAFVGARVHIVDTTIRRCSGDIGGGVFAYDSILEIETSTIRDNPASYSVFIGGGIQVVSGTLAMRGCVVAGNRAFRGAGVDVSSAPSTFEDTLFESNHDPMGCLEGGAIRGAGQVRRCTFVGNRAQFGGALHGNFVVERSTFLDNGFDQLDASFGGAVYGTGGGMHLSGCRLEDNHCSGHGGAAHGATLVDCLVRGNRAASHPGASEDGLGGGLHDCDAVRCRIEGNRAVDGGSAALAVRGGGAHGGTLTRCVLAGNTARTGAGAARAVLDRCTVLANVAAIAGGGLAGAGAASNSILWSNAPDQIADDGTGLPFVSWSDIQGGGGGTNIDLDPLLWGPASGDVHLRPGSPCIDAGDPNEVDPDGSRVDMGARPFDAQYQGAPGNYCEGKVTSEGCLARSDAIGSPSISSGTYTVRALEVPAGTTGLVFLAHRPESMPHLFGTICVSGPLVRTAPVTASGLGPCDGVLLRSLAGTELLSAGFAAGDRLYAQWIFRDVAHPDGSGLGLTDGLEAVVGP